MAGRHSRPSPYAPTVRIPQMGLNAAEQRDRDGDIARIRFGHLYRPEPPTVPYEEQPDEPTLHDSENQIPTQTLNPVIPLRSRAQAPEPQTTTLTGEIFGDRRLYWGLGAEFAIGALAVTTIWMYGPSPRQDRPTIVVSPSTTGERQISPTSTSQKSSSSSHSSHPSPQSSRTASRSTTSMSSAPGPTSLPSSNPTISLTVSESPPMLSATTPTTDPTTFVTTQPSPTPFETTSPPPNASIAPTQSPNTAPSGASSNFATIHLY